MLQDDPNTANESNTNVNRWKLAVGKCKFRAYEQTWATHVAPVTQSKSSMRFVDFQFCGPSGV